MKALKTSNCIVSPLPWWGLSLICSYGPGHHTPLPTLLTTGSGCILMSISWFMPHCFSPNCLRSLGHCLLISGQLTKPPTSYFLKSKQPYWDNASPACWPGGIWMNIDGQCSMIWYRKNWRNIRPILRDPTASSGLAGCSKGFSEALGKSWRAVRQTVTEGTVWPKG